MGRKVRNNVSNLGIEANSGATNACSTENKTNVDGQNEETTIIQPPLVQPMPRESFKNAVERAVDLSMDISSAVTGIVLLDHVTGALVKMDFIKLNTSKLTTLFEKADYAALWLKENVKGFSVKRIFVEANAKGFSAGFSSADTLFTLAKINVLISYLAHKQFGAPVFDINVTSARSKIGYKDNRKIKKPVKEKVREFVLYHHPSLPIKKHIAKTGKSKGQEVMDAEMADCVDAFVIGLGGRLLNP